MENSILFINITNHPSNEWKNAQLKAAQAFGDVEDFPFPVVSPDMSSEDVNQLALEYADNIMHLFGTNIIVHVMGEMTFTFMLVTKLKGMGIRCVASATERKVKVNEDGSILSEFSFVKFREY